jgi:Cys-tRNA(Pro)/Cys-tRNA(Cys) deacylase
MVGAPQAVRILRSRGIPFELHSFDASITSASALAVTLGLSPERVYKTLIVEAEPAATRPIVIMVPSTIELDLKHIAPQVGVKRLRMALQRDAERVTGMRVGAISPIPLAGQKFELFIAEDALGLETVLVSAGERGMDVELTVGDLLSLTGARAIAIQRR